MKKLLFSLLLLGGGHGAALAAPNLHIICPVSTYNGKPVSDWCPGQTYRAPSPTDLVRTAPIRNPEWQATNYRWLPYAQVAAGQYTEVCLTDIPAGTLEPGACQLWDRIVKVSTAVLRGRTNLTWTLPAKFTDNSNIPAAKDIAIMVWRWPEGGDVTTVVPVTTLLGRPVATNLTAEPYGRWCYYLTAVVDGIQSDPSGGGCKTVRLPAPSDGRISAPTDGVIN